MTFHTLTDGTMVKLSSVDVIGPILPDSDFGGFIADTVPAGTHGYRIVTLGFSGSAGALGLNPLVRLSTDLAAITAERNALIAAVQAL